MIEEAIQKISGDEDLTRGEAERVMEEILAGRASEASIAAILTALDRKGD